MKIVDKHIQSPHSKNCLNDGISALRDKQKLVVPKKVLQLYLHPDRYNASYPDIIRAIVGAIFNIVQTEEQAAEEKYESLKNDPSKLIALINQEAVLNETRLKHLLIRGVEIIGKGNQLKLKQEDIQTLQNATDTKGLSQDFASLLKPLARDILLNNVDQTISQAAMIHKS